jgi:hypothetical protein
VARCPKASKSDRRSFLAKLVSLPSSDLEVADVLVRVEIETKRCQIHASDQSGVVGEVIHHESKALEAPFIDFAHMG